MMALEALLFGQPLAASSGLPETPVVLAIFIGLAALMSSVFAIYTQVKDRGRSVSKQEGEIQISDAQRKLITEEAAKLGSEERRKDRIESEQWFTEQIGSLRDELGEEQRARRELTDWANLHQIWDRRAWILALESDPDYPPPPSLGKTDDETVKRIQKKS